MVGPEEMDQIMLEKQPVVKVVMVEIEMATLKVVIKVQVEKDQPLPVVLPELREQQ